MIYGVEEEEASTSTTTAPIALRSTEVSEAYDELSATVRPTTILAYKSPLAHWETYCKENFEGPEALVLLHEYQRRCWSIEWGSPKDCEELTSLLKQFEHSLVYDQVRTSVDRAARCVIRDSYKPGQLIRMLKTLWLSASRTSPRETFSISTRHHMLLRDHNMRNVNFTDCFATIIPCQQHQGS
ncbi:hypothetical protein [Parasitella parasitica]|uniref:Uncharacterized protein n=1 Tax=Parasitella parasitica TaxID=35722 RepID=A0A0B7NAR1_9FUNG|nr:hypothetical protein [Parasitella parasitica]